MYVSCPRSLLRGSLNTNSDILVRLARQLSLDLERARGIVLRNNELDELDFARFGELGVIQEVVQLGLGLDSVRLTCLAFDTSERGKEACPVPIIMEKPT